MTILSHGIYGQSNSIPKEFARSLLSLVAHETKLSLIAERRLLGDLRRMGTTVIQLERELERPTLTIKTPDELVRALADKKYRVKEARSASPNFRNAFEPHSGYEEYFRIPSPTHPVWDRWVDLKSQENPYFANDNQGPRFQRKLRSNDTNTAGVLDQSMSRYQEIGSGASNDPIESSALSDCGDCAKTSLKVAGTVVAVPVAIGVLDAIRESLGYESFFAAKP